MVLIEEEYVRRELEFIPAKCKVIEYYSQIYGCPSCKEGLGDTEKPVIVKSQVPETLLEKRPAPHQLWHGPCIRSMQAGFPSIVRKRTGNSMAHNSARPHLPTGSSIVLSIIFSQCMIFHRQLLKHSFAMADETKVQVLKEDGRRAIDTVIHVAVLER